MQVVVIRDVQLRSRKDNQTIIGIIAMAIRIVVMAIKMVVMASRIVVMTEGLPS